MTSKPHKIYLITGAIVFTALLLFFAGRLFVFHKIHGMILSEADSLRARGYDVYFDSISSNSLTGSISAKNVRIKFPSKPGSCADTLTNIRLKEIEVSGLGLVALVLKKEIKLKRVRIESPWLQYKPGHAVRKNKRQAKSKLRSFDLDDLVITQARIDQFDSGSCASSMNTRFNLDMHHIHIENPGDSARRIELGEATIDHFVAKLPAAFYTITLQRLEWNAPAKSLNLDSLKIKPDYNKEEFARKTGVQIDRIDCVIPSIALSGVDFTLTRSPSFRIGRAELGFIAEVFHDKRYPSGKPKIKYLPSRAIRRLPFDLQVDSIVIAKSSVTYEEVPVGGERAGMVSFNELGATIRNLSTRSKEEASMRATARFMNASDLRANFTFPADPTKPYTIHGSVMNLNMPEINKILVPIAHVEVKSGVLREMKFDYTYNEYRSDGELTMNYKDLDVASLIKNGKDKDENKFVTLILHAIVKKDMDKDKSQGKILFYHDPQRSTINYWWKSILSGVKSLYNLDKILDTSHSKKK